MRKHIDSLLNLELVLFAKRILFLSDKKSKYIAFGIGTILTYAILLICNVRDYYGDTERYWAQSESLFNVDGHLGLNYDPDLAIRGYGNGLFIFACRGFKLLPIQGYWAIWSLFISAFFTILLPYLFTFITKKPFTFIARLTLLTFILFFWPFVYLYPASELPAFCFASLALLALFKLIKYDSETDNSKRIILERGLFSALLGASLYLSYNIRPVFTYNIIIALVLLVWFYRKKLLKLLPLLLVCAISFSVVATPQLLINKNVYHKVSISSPLALASPRWGNNEYIMCYSGSVQAFLGSMEPEIQRAVPAFDPIAEKLWKTDGGCNGFTYKKWLSALYHHPMQMLGIYGVKLVNFFDLRYGDIYFNIHEIGDRVLKNLLGYLFWFVAFAGLFLQIRSRRSCMKSEDSAQNVSQISVIKQLFTKEKNYLGQAVLFFIFPIFPAFLTSVEQRYFLPLFIICGIYLANYFPWKKLKENVKQNIFTYILVLGGVFMVIQAVYNLTFAINPELLDVIVR